MRAASNLAQLIDMLALGGSPRDRSFVRAVAAWLHEHRGRLRLPMLEALKARDVVLTLVMQDDVALCITFYLEDWPGDATVRVVEADFPRVAIDLVDEPVGDPYVVCTLDYERRGEPVALAREVVVRGARWPEGTRGWCQVVSTEGERSYVRVRPDGGGASFVAPLEAVVFFTTRS